ncbi:unnamed protein product [Cuscuta europaea]|uniref:Uncharacterized protein n=1 Tax=Cuscuta europaea TaxID=41803 RepID=A0A9P0YPD7_CUSEU|nr:unnamed protein product [Cuscuta europaea]
METKKATNTGTYESSSRLTRSRGGSFDILQDCDEEFPALINVSANKSFMKKPAVNSEAICDVNSAATKVQGADTESIQAAANGHKDGNNSAKKTGAPQVVENTFKAAPDKLTQSLGIAGTKSAAKIPGPPGTVMATENNELISQSAEDVGQNMGSADAHMQATSNPLKAAGVGQVNGSEVQKLWSSLFKDNRDPSNGLKLRYIPPKGTSLDFTDRVLPSMVDMWEFCLVGFLTGKFPSLKAVHNLKNTWGVS